VVGEEKGVGEEGGETKKRVVGLEEEVEMEMGRVGVAV
jgi:hypothetical protein